MFEAETKSIPSFVEFSPFHIPYQAQVIHDIDFAFDYSIGAHEILLSGSVGSAKSLLAAHIGVKHVLRNPRAHLALCRRALPDIKKTIFLMVLEHLECQELKEGRDYWVKETSAEIEFRNGSKIFPIYWADKKYKRARSVALSGALFEELTENDEKDKQAFMEIKARIGRLPHIKERFSIACTNPDGPRHWAYNYFIKPNLGGIKHPTRHVYYSNTEQNPFLDRAYIEQLKADYDPKLARRMIYGEWVEIDQERIYYAYDSERNFLANQTYEIRRDVPIALCFDFNIGVGKPFSSCAYQFFNDTFHVFDSVKIEGARTPDAMREWAEKGIFGHGCKIIIHGDASGDARDTRSILSDYEIIKGFLRDIPGLIWAMEVPRANPPIRTRHNRVNAYCMNDKKQARLFVYKGADAVDESLRLTALKSGGEFVEDDSKHWQHISSALGYGLVYDTNKSPTQISNQRLR